MDKCFMCYKEVEKPGLKSTIVCAECKKKAHIGFWAMVIENEEFLDEAISPKHFLESELKDIEI